ncbi:MAG: hypothetical protein P1Q69_11470 [Candidatus Thorarchaeota archaeon]|nr:hypothetical protein [Candidatus Thorarchaeota archaeon]
MESLEAAAIRNYLRDKRIKTLQNLMTLNGEYNEFLKELRERREIIAKERSRGQIGLREFWDARVNLEDQIRDIEEKRDDVVKQIVMIFPKTK